MTLTLCSRISNQRLLWAENDIMSMSRLLSQWWCSWRYRDCWVSDGAHDDTETAESVMVFMTIQRLLSQWWCSWRYIDCWVSDGAHDDTETAESVMVFMTIQRLLSQWWCSWRYRNCWVSDGAHDDTDTVESVMVLMTIQRLLSQWWCSWRYRDCWVNTESATLSHYRDCMSLLDSFYELLDKHQRNQSWTKMALDSQNPSRVYNSVVQFLQ